MLPFTPYMHVRCAAVCTIYYELQCFAFTVILVLLCNVSMLPQMYNCMYVWQYYYDALFVLLFFWALIVIG